MKSIKKWFVATVDPQQRVPEITGPFDSADDAESWRAQLPEAILSSSGVAAFNINIHEDSAAEPNAAYAVYTKASRASLWRLSGEHAGAEAAWRAASILRNKAAAEGDFGAHALAVTGPRRFPESLEEISGASIIVDPG